MFRKKKIIKRELQVLKPQSVLQFRFSDVSTQHGSELCLNLTVFSSLCKMPTFQTIWNVAFVKNAFDLFQHPHLGCRLCGFMSSMKRHQPARPLAWSRGIQGRGRNDACKNVLLSMKCPTRARRLFSLLVSAVRN